METKSNPARHKGTTKGFARTSTLLTKRIRKASESRGFAQTRLLTHWAEIAGDDIAAVSRPVEVSFGRGGFGATLTLLTTGAHAPTLEMQKEQLRARVNAVYGYNAIVRVRITQTAATGFAEGQVDFQHRPARKPTPTTSPEIAKAARETTQDVADETLRQALERLAANVISKDKSQG
ncbi:MAG: DciA family protein [Paracoccaceae bacterium]|nr:DciA family protein [Paracoccaceae bacterium]